MDFNATGYFKGRDGVSDIAYYVKAPENPRAILQLSHGMCEYFRRYDEFGEFLNAHGFVLIGNDHIAHGASVKSEKELGIMPAGGAEFAVEDLYNVSKTARELFPTLPLIIFGHSMGSFLVRDYLTKYGHYVDGAVICGTGGPNPAVDIGIALAAIQSKIFPRDHRAKMINAMVFGSCNRKYDHPRTPNDWLTRNEAIVDKFRDNPYCSFTFTPQSFKELFTVNKKVNLPEWGQQLPRLLPILIISGDMDPIGDFGRGVMQVYDNIVNARGEDFLTIKLYPEARHELLNELNKDEVMADFMDWAEKIVDKA